MLALLVSIFISPVQALPEFTCPEGMDPQFFIRLALKKEDPSMGRGYERAQIFTSNSQTPAVLPIPLTAAQKRLQQPFFVVSETKKAGTAIFGIPSSVYIDAQGSVAYIAYSTPVSLWDMSEGRFRPLPGQGVDRHHGFSAPVGPLKAGQSYGSVGEQVTLEYASGVKVVGVVQSFTFTKTGKNTEEVSLVTFKAGTTTVTYGVHTLFEPSWGEYDLLVMPQITNSNEATFRISP